MKVTVKQARILSDMTQGDASQVLGVHRHTYMKYEKNPGLMPLDKAFKFAEIVGMPFDDIFFGGDSTNRREEALTNAETPQNRE